MNSTQTPSFRRLFEALSILLLTSLASLGAQVVSFDVNEHVTLESGWFAISQPSGFTRAEQAEIMQMVNAKLLAAGIAPGAVSGSTGPCRIIISNSQAPPVTGVQGNKTDIGAGGGDPAIVFIQEHDDVPMAEHMNDIANAIKALIAAKHGAGANLNSTATAMTQVQGRAAYTDLPYGRTAAIQMALNRGIMNAMTETSSRPTDVRYRLDTTPGRRLNSLDVQLTYHAGLQSGSQFGHLRADDTFVAFGKQGLLESAPASFYFDGEGVDFAIKLSNGAIYSLSSGRARVRLLAANSHNFEVHNRVAVDFDVDGNGVPDAKLDIVLPENSTGGFYTNVYRGTGDDLFLTGSVNARAAFLAGQRNQVAHAGDALHVQIRSLEQLFANSPVFLVGEVFGDRTPVPLADFPSIYFGATDHFIMLFGNPGRTGLHGSFFIPPGLEGLMILMQAVVIDALAANGFYGASDAMTVTFR